MHFQTRRRIGQNSGGGKAVHCIFHKTIIIWCNLVLQHRNVAFSALKDMVILKDYLRLNDTPVSTSSSLLSQFTKEFAKDISLVL